MRRSSSILAALSGSARNPTTLMDSQALIRSSNNDIFCAEKRAKMRTTLALDDELLADAEFYTGIREKSALVREALKALVEREAARRLARLGGSEPQLKPIPRRRPKPK
jgi:Arc/MetJ family transcription regulator